ncbi:hypothetical protein JXK06_00875 [Patescibacteria group bacterium]|nr:hypothetical protein [Patescibacteria group bacterium]
MPTKSKTKTKAKKSKLLSEVKSKKILIAIFGILILMLILILINFLSLLKTRQELKTYLLARQIAEEALPNKIEENQPTNSSGIIDSWVGMGDHFSSFAYLDKNKTDLVLDQAVSALVFPPIFSLDLVGDGSDLLNSNLEADDRWILSESKEFCALSPVNNCLEVRNEKEVFYNNQQIDLPQEMQDEKIKKIDASFLSSKFVLSFVVEAENNQEEAYAYFFDGRRYSPLISKNSEEKIISQYGRGNGTMVAGGSDDEFILLYNGYEAKAFYYQAGKLSDISRFFGLRVSDGGFYPHIIKQGSGANSLWYILSFSEKKPRLIKLWQNGSLEIKGAYDFSYIFKDFSALKLLAFRATPDMRGEFEFIFSTDENNRSLSLKNPGTWRFKDGGFDNSKERQVFSLNLNTKDAYVTKAYVEMISFNTGFGSEARVGNKASNLAPELYFLGSDMKKIPAQTNQEISFAPANREFYWQAVFPPSSNSEYSPFFESISSLYYFISGEEN